MKTKEKGDIAESAAIYYYTSRKEQVLLPFGDKQKYDIVIVRNNQFLKVQCKYTSYKTPYGIYSVPIGVCGGNQKSYNFSKYTVNDFDLLFILTDSKVMYEIPNNICLLNNKQINLGVKFDQYKV